MWGSVGIGAGKCIEMWESVWDECGKVCWGVGGGEERCGGCKEVWGEVCESWGRVSWCEKGLGSGG